MLRWLLLLAVLIIISCKQDVVVITDPISKECKNTAVVEIDPTMIDVVADDTLHIPIKYHFIFSDSINLLLEQVYDIKALDIVHEQLNAAYKGKIVFDRDSVDNHHIYRYDLVDLYNDYKYGKGKLWNRLIDKYVEEGYYNVFIIQSVRVNPTSHLLGFAPVLSTDFDEYQVVSPKYDNVAVSYAGLFDYEAGTTVIHETGHWLGLSHPFEISFKDKVELGLTSNYKICINYMNYNCFVAEFTEEQIRVQYNFAKKYRKYLLK